MVLTRAGEAAIFNHIVNDLLDESEGGTIRQALANDGITRLFDLTSLAVADIEDLCYTVKNASGDGTTKRQLDRGSRNKIKLLLEWIGTKREVGQLSTDDEWKNLSLDEFQEYRLNPRVAIASSILPVPNSVSSASSNISVKHELEAFKRSVKRDGAIYPVLRDEKDWDGWNRSMQAIARSHDVSEILDPDYKPDEDEYSNQLFNQKLSFMYSVLNRVVLTDMGKTIVRKHEHTYDAQAVYKELIDYFKNSTAANIGVGKLIEFLTMARLDSRWNGTTLGFILHWRDRMRLYEELTPTDEHYGEGAKKRMLQAAVEAIPELRIIATQEETLVATGNSKLSYANYINLLNSAAARRDNTMKVVPSRSKRTVHQASTNYGMDYDLDYNIGYVEEPNSTIDVDVDYDIEYEVNAAERQLIPGSIWHSLSKEAKEYFRKQGSIKPVNKNGVNNAKNSTKFSNNRQVKLHSHDKDVTAEIQNLEEEFFEACEINHDDSHGHDLHANANEQQPSHPGDIRNVLTSSSKAAKPKIGNNKGIGMGEKIEINGKIYYAANTIEISYQSYTQQMLPKLGSLVDRGANGGIGGNDVVLLEKSMRTCDISGIDNYTMKRLPIGTCAGKVKTNQGIIIVILHQYAYTGKGNTIHSSTQLEHFGNIVDDRSTKVKGKQHIVTLSGYVIPLHIRNGLAYLDMCKPTKEDLETYTHVALTSDADWNPRCMDNEQDIDNSIGQTNSSYDNTLDYITHHANIQHSSKVDYDDYLHAIVKANNLNVDVAEPKYELLKPNFGYAPVDVIKKTFKCTTQWAKIIERYPFRKHFKSRFPALNVTRRSEPVATDTIFADVPAINNGCKLAQLYVGCNTFVTDVYPMKLESHFSITLLENIRKRGAMDKLVSDRAKVEISSKVQEILRHYHIDDSQSEPYHEHQNPAERRYQTVKTYVNVILDRTGAPPTTWLLCMQYICAVLNLTYNDKLNTTPLHKLTGQTQDISILLPFRFYEPVYYATADKLSYNSSVSFPSDSAEAKGWFVGFGDSVGDALTFKVLTDDTKIVIFRSSVRSALTGPPNVRLEPAKGELSFTPSPPPLVQSEVDQEHEAFGLADPNHSGEDQDNSLANGIVDTNLLEFPLLTLSDLSYDTSESEQEAKRGNIKGYNDALDHIEHQLHPDYDPEAKLWKFTHIVSHEGPLEPTSPAYKGSKYNLLVAWEDGTQTYEPLKTIAEDDPVTVAKYAKENNLLNLPGWRRLKHLVRNMHRLERQVKVHKSIANFCQPKYKFGVEIPKSVKHALELDRKSGNTLWQDAIALEVGQILDYETFDNLGKDATPPPGYKRIRLHFVFDVKHDGRYKARLVAGGHLTDEPDDSVYSSVVSLRDLRLAIFIGELNGLDVWGADVGNAYLESFTKELLYVVAGPEFGPLEGSILVIKKALYGLRSSGLRWHERFADTLRDLSFKQCKACPDVWMRNMKDHYEYIAVYVDDLAIISKDPKLITDTLVNDFKYKLKGVGPIDYHLGGNFGRDDDGTLRYGPRKYIDKLITSYVNMFGCQPITRTTPMVKGDHPELDDSPELDKDGIKQYQSMIGALQWTVTLGRFDIMAAVMTMSRFRIAPRIGHLDRLKRVYGYLKKFRNGDIRFRTGEPDLSKLEKVNYDWSNTVYEDYKEDPPGDIPDALGPSVVTLTYVDANLLHCLSTGRASTGILHLVNGTPVDW